MCDNNKIFNFGDGSHDAAKFILGVFVFLILLNLWTVFHHDHGNTAIASKNTGMWQIYDLNKELQSTKTRALCVIKLRKEYFQLAQENNYYAHDYVELQNEENLSREYYEKLIRKYNQLMNINYSLLGSSPLAATLHIKNDLPL
ncbi:MAG: hypothetical protein PHT40_01870 [Patescibacteria group bacterium]|nr:hypothetical protein [Patescibacteria group bacterium]